LPLIVPPVDVTAPVRLPFEIVPPARLTVLIVCAKPPRFSVPVVLTVVAETALNALAAEAVRTPTVMGVSPV
jgi:hypothetical protein